MQASVCLEECLSRENNIWSVK